MFLGSSEDIIKRTFEATTQFERSVWITRNIYNTYKSPFPTMNVVRRNEPLGTDMVYSYMEEINCRVTRSQFFTVIDTIVCDSFGPK